MLLVAVAATCSRQPEPRTASAPPAESSQSFSQVGPFSLVERSGAKVTLDDLLGHAWAASFVFTRCTGPCPAVVSTLRRLQDRLRDTPIRIVTVSVDPAWDTPEVLRKYAAEVGADPKRWLFLTGEEKAIDALVRTSFLSPVERSGDAPIGQHVTHRTQLAAVDRKGRVRGFYHGESGSDLDLLVERLRFLERGGG